MEFLNRIPIYKFLSNLGKEGVLAFNISKEKVRFVTHYGISKDDIQYSIGVIGKVLLNFYNN
jgi:hypothetical protein